MICIWCVYGVYMYIYTLTLWGYRSTKKSLIISSKLISLLASSLSCSPYPELGLGLGLACSPYPAAAIGEEGPAHDDKNCSIRTRNGSPPSYIHIYVHTYIHTCLHTYTYTYIPPFPYLAKRDCLDQKQGVLSELFFLYS